MICKVLIKLKGPAQILIFIKAKNKNVDQSKMSLPNEPIIDTLRVIKVTAWQVADLVILVKILETNRTLSNLLSVGLFPRGCLVNGF